MINPNEISVLKNYSYYEICNAFNEDCFFDTEERFNTTPDLIWNLASPYSKVNIKKLITFPTSLNPYWVRKQKFGFEVGEYEEYFKSILSNDDFIIFGYEDYKPNPKSDGLDSVTVFYLEKADMTEENPYIQSPEWEKNPSTAPADAVNWKTEKEMYDLIMPLQ